MCCSVRKPPQECVACGVEWGAHNVKGLHIVYTVHFVNRGLILFFRFFRVVAYRQFTRL